MKIQEQEEDLPSPIKDFKATLSKNNANKISKGMMFRSVEIRKVSVTSTSRQSHHQATPAAEKPIFFEDSIKQMSTVTSTENNSL